MRAIVAIKAQLDPRVWVDTGRDLGPVPDLSENRRYQSFLGLVDAWVFLLIGALLALHFGLHFDV